MGECDCLYSLADKEDTTISVKSLGRCWVEKSLQCESDLHKENITLNSFSKEDGY